MQLVCQRLWSAVERRVPLSFRTPNHAAVVYTDSVGVAMLKLMGRTGRVPGALDAGQVPAALDGLRQGLTSGAEQSGVPPVSAAGDTVPIGAEIRALPLVELLEAAIAAGDYVNWDRL